MSVTEVNMDEAEKKNILSLCACLTTPTLWKKKKTGNFLTNQLPTVFYDMVEIQGLEIVQVSKTKQAKSENAYDTHSNKYICNISNRAMINSTWIDTTHNKYEVCTCNPYKVVFN